MATTLSQPLRCLFALFALFALVVLAMPAGAADSDEVDAVLDGTWQFSTVGTTAGMSSRPQDYTQVRRVHFANGAFDQNPLGFESQGFRLVTCASGGPVVFETPYGIGGGNYAMTFKGQGDDHLTHLTGSFEFCMASGTFSAVHLAAEFAPGQLSVSIGRSGAARVHLTLQPDAPVTVHGVRLRGERKLVVSPQALTFTAQTWDQDQDLLIDATAVRSPGQAIVGIVGPGVPETWLVVQLVRPALTAH